MKLNLKGCSDPETVRAFTRAFRAATTALGIDNHAMIVDVSLLPPEFTTQIIDTPFGSARAIGVVGGETECYFKGNVATIRLFALNTASVCETLIHELVHVAQMVRGDLQRINGVAVWKGQRYRNPRSQEEYEAQPWEREANSLASIISRRLK